MGANARAVPILVMHGNADALVTPLASRRIVAQFRAMLLLANLEKQAIPLGRLGTAAEAAGGVYLFCIPESDYISGQVVTVGGGIVF